MKFSTLLLFAGTTATASALRGANNDEGKNSNIHKRRSLVDRKDRSFSYEDCVPAVILEDRDGEDFLFEKEGDEGICVDGSNQDFDHGEQNNIVSAVDCAAHCIDILDFEKIKHLVGLNFNCEDRLCRCLYDNEDSGDLVRSDRNKFRSYDSHNSGSGSVDGVEENSGWECYTNNKSSSSSSDRRRRSDASRTSYSYDSDDCGDTSISQDREGTAFVFEQEGNEGTCVDGSSEDYEYGEKNRIDNAGECAEHCIGVLALEKVQKMVGFDYNCRQRLCRCLYDNSELGQNDRNEFTTYMTSNSGSGSVDKVKENSGWECYVNIKSTRSSDNSGSTSSSSSSSGASNDDCGSSSISEDREGHEFIFQPEEDEGLCVDSASNDYDFGEEKDINNAEDCAKHCINVFEDFSKIIFLVGFDYNCGKRRCNCLYEDDELSRADENKFDSYHDSRSGSGSVDHVEDKGGWTCYVHSFHYMKFFNDR